MISIIELALAPPITFWTTYALLMRVVLRNPTIMHQIEILLGEDNDETHHHQ